VSSQKGFARLVFSPFFDLLEKRRDGGLVGDFEKILILHCFPGKGIPSKAS